MKSSVTQIIVDKVWFTPICIVWTLGEFAEEDCDVVLADTPKNSKLPKSIG